MAHFSHPEPRKYINKLENWLGSPSVEGKEIVEWEQSVTPELKGTPYLRITVRDEYIPHSFPAKHHDFVYSVAKIQVTSNQACELLKVSGSILIDLLKNEVGARCGGLTANDVTLSFVLDVVQGKAKATKDEYKRRITNKIVTRKQFDSYKKIEKGGHSDDCILF